MAASPTKMKAPVMEHRRNKKKKKPTVLTLSSQSFCPQSPYIKRKNVVRPNCGQIYFSRHQDMCWEASTLSSP
ncbi:hypothetical protein V6N12_066476 [Hibiscus sabdariffa]|uniref:Uncharacterized protein n=1 Tax=Hibiscus sabdariffa TaxID=183260 RepID=A0ABR2CQ91_9ROSI